VTWVELTGADARDNGQGGLDEEDWKPDPLSPCKVFGWEGKPYPRAVVSAGVYPGRSYPTTGDSYPAGFAISYGQKLSPKHWWSTGIGASQGLLPIEFYDVAMGLLRQAIEAHKTKGAPDVPCLPEVWKLRLDEPDDDEDEDEP
jgi:hypothetical protein